MNLISKKEYALKYKISQAAVTKACKNGRLQVVNGKVDGDFVLSLNRKQVPINSSDTSSLGLRQELEVAKLAKIKADTEYQLQRLEARKQEDFEEIAEVIYTAYTVAFAPLQSELIKLHLNANQIQILKEIISTCNKNFKLEVAKGVRNAKKKAS